MCMLVSDWDWEMLESDFWVFSVERGGLLQTDTVEMNEGSCSTNLMTAKHYIDLPFRK